MEIEILLKILSGQKCQSADKVLTFGMNLVHINMRPMVKNVLNGTDSSVD